MRTYHVIDCTKLEGVSASIFGPVFVAHIAAWAWSVCTGRTHDYIPG